MIAKWSLWSLLAVAALISPSTQEPQPPQRPPAPPAAAPLVPVQEPYVEGVPRHDLPERFGRRDPIEGVWQLHARSVGGQVAPAGTGYLMVSRRHLFVHFEAPSADPAIPLLRAGAYTWARAGEPDLVRTMVLGGHFNDASGDVHLEPPGTAAMRRFELGDRFLRLWQENGDWLEFARAE